MPYDKDIEDLLTATGKETLDAAREAMFARLAKAKRDAEKPPAVAARVLKLVKRA